MLTEFNVGDRVRVDIPDEADPDYDIHHGRQGEVAEVIVDDAGEETLDERDSIIYQIKFDNGETGDFRWRDLRPAFDEANDG